MTAGDPPPEIPPPGWLPRPDRTPDDPRPVIVPSVPAQTVPWPDDPVAQLRAERRLLLTGPLDQPVADRLCAELMLADGRSADPIELIVNSRGGPTEAVLGVLDTIDLLRAPLATRCIGSAVGTAALVLASGTARRSVGANATISLRLAGDHRLDGDAATIARGAEALADVMDGLARRLATVSHLTIDEARDALRAGGHLSASDAVAVGLVDGIAGS
jgi:ATP-dependent Clp protease protease subunit